MTKVRLTALDWIAAAFRALVTGGPQAIRAEAIARDLKVSKGSFYWHFKNVEDLKLRMLEHWQERATDEIISAIEEISGAPDVKLRKLVEIATSELSEPYGGTAVEAAIRDWGRYSDKVRQAVAHVDAQRLLYVQEQFLAFGYTQPKSKSCASLLYAALIGLEILSTQNLANLKNDLTTLLDTLLQDKDLAKS